MGLFAYWKQLLTVGIVIAIFFIGWHLRGMQDQLKADKEAKKEYKAIKKASDYNNSIDLKAQKDITKLYNQTNDLNQKLKVTYEDSAYKCLIPASGLQLIAKTYH